MLSSDLVAILLFLTNALPIISALGINCRGSALCDRASLSNQQSVGIIQILRDVVYASSMPNSTNYASGDHIICLSQSQEITFNAGIAINGISGGIGLSINSPQGGICLFPQYLTVANLNLGQIKPLVDAILEHGCGTCGSVPIHFVDEWSNDPSDGILTFNYVQSPFCVGNCISDTGSLSSSAPSGVSSTPTTASSSSLAAASSSSTTSPAMTSSSGTSASINEPTTVTEALSVTVTDTGASASGTLSSKSAASRLRGWRCGIWVPVIAILSYFP